MGSWTAAAAMARRQRRSPLRTLVVVVALVLLGAVAQAAAAAAVTQPSGDAMATVETAPVPETGDAADDPAIWVDAADPVRSVVIGNDKKGGLEVYDLAGNRIQRIAEGFFGNVDVRRGFASGTRPLDLVVTYRLGIRTYRIDPVTRQLANVTDSGTGSIPVGFSGEGLCLYHSPVTGQTYAFVDARSGRIAQFRLSDTDGDGLVEATKVRDWNVGSEIEGCVADDELGTLYVAEEDVAIWRYSAEPTAPTGPGDRAMVDAVTSGGGHLTPDIEGLTIVYQPDGMGYLLASSQAGSNKDNYYAVYERQGDNAFVRTFKVANGPEADGCGRTDGIDAYAGDLGPSFPHGLFVCQDNYNWLPASGNQNFKFVPLERVVGLVEQPPPPQDEVISFVGAASSDANAVVHRLAVPSTVAPGDALVLFFGENTTATVSDPTGVTGWDALRTVTGPKSVTRAWAKVAGPDDAGRTLAITVSARSKADLALVAYRGTSATAPVAAVSATLDAPNRSAHATPVAPVADARSWVVSYWTHKDAVTTALVPPDGVTTRAAGTQSGSGRVTGLLADSGASVPAGSYGGLSATAAGPTTNASMWTVVLAPGTT